MIELCRRKIGVNINNAKASVQVWAPLAREVEICCKGEKISLEKKDIGYWETETKLLKTGDRYQVLVDGKQHPDPASLYQPEGVHGPSEIVDLHAYQWTDKEWNNIPLGDYIIYELHTGTFSEQGDFKGIETRLDHLLDLGITAIEIMPVAQFPGDRNWGYDGVYPFAVQNSYGGPMGLKRLVNACHQKGLAVILDVVYNHLGPEGNYMSQFGPFYVDKYNTPWGQAINFDDAWCDGIRNYFIENALMWFRDFHVDALRLDAVHAIKDFSSKHILAEIKEHVAALEKDTGRKYWLMIECDLNDPKFIDPLAKRGYGMDAQWTDEFHHALRVTAGEKKLGYYSDFNGVEDLAKSYKDGYVYDGQFSMHRKKFFGAKANNNAGKQFIVFSQNHDQVGNRMLGDRSSKLYSFELQKLLAAAVVLSPFIPMLFMGEEWGESNPFLYFISHSEPELIAAVRKGRKEEFSAFHLEGEAPDPFAMDTFNQSKLSWNLKDKGKHGVLFQYYKALLSLRKNHPVLKELNRQNLEVYCYKEKNVLLLERWNNDQKIFSIMNFSSQQQKIELQTDKMLQLIFNSASAKWEGKSMAASTINPGTCLEVQSESVLVYEFVPAF